MTAALRTLKGFARRNGDHLKEIDLVHLCSEASLLQRGQCSAADGCTPATVSTVANTAAPAISAAVPGGRGGLCTISDCRESESVYTHLPQLDL